MFDFSFFERVHVVEMLDDLTKLTTIVTKIDFKGSVFGHERFSAVQFFCQKVGFYIVNGIYMVHSPSCISILCWMSSLFFDLRIQVSAAVVFKRSPP